ncbi:hypothetical protein MKW92_037170 [Papaver armeniacum]|nr:hypothetical protein MKW92_037170 [Papaver armeniacum]
MGYAHYQDCKRKSSSSVGYGTKENKKMKSEGRSEKVGSGKSFSSKVNNNGVDSSALEKELWSAIAGGENFIDDTCMDPSDCYGSDAELLVPVAPRAKEVDDEVERLFKGCSRKKKKNEKSPEELGLEVEQIMAKLEIAAESDSELNIENKPAINKIINLPLLVNVLSKKQLQFEFLDRGVLTLLKNWLEPLPDGSLPNINVRTGVLEILTELRIDLEDYGRREQLENSGLAKTAGNRKLAKDLIDKWSRPIFNKSTRFEDSMKYNEDNRVLCRRPMVKKKIDKTVILYSRDDDVDEFTRQRNSGESSSNQHASRPEASPMDFNVRPQSKIDPDEIRARSKLAEHDQCRLKINKKLQQLKASKKK